jgi:hypothetical protein
MYNLTFRRLETDNGTDMVGLLLTNTFLQCCIGKSCFISEGLVKFDDEIVFEIVRYTAAVFGRITDNFVFFRDHFDIGTFVKRIHYDIRMFIFRESEAEKDSAFRRGHLRHDLSVSTRSSHHVPPDRLRSNTVLRSHFCERTSWHVYPGQIQERRQPA